MTNINYSFKPTCPRELNFYSVENTGWTGNDHSWFSTNNKRYSSIEEAELVFQKAQERLPHPTLHRIVHTNIKVTESQTVTTETYIIK